MLAFDKLCAKLASTKCILELGRLPSYDYFLETFRKFTIHQLLKNESLLIGNFVDFVSDGLRDSLTSPNNNDVLKHFFRQQGKTASFIVTFSDGNVRKHSSEVMLSVFGYELNLMEILTGSIEKEEKIIPLLVTDCDGKYKDKFEEHKEFEEWKKTILSLLVGVVISYELASLIDETQTISLEHFLYTSNYVKLKEELQKEHVSIKFLNCLPMEITPPPVSDRVRAPAVRPEHVLLQHFLTSASRNDPTQVFAYKGALLSDKGALLSDVTNDINESNNGDLSLTHVCYWSKKPPPLTENNSTTTYLNFLKNNIKRLYREYIIKKICFCFTKQSSLKFLSKEFGRDSKEPNRTITALLNNLLVLNNSDLLYPLYLAEKSEDHQSRGPYLNYSNHLQIVSSREVRITTMQEKLFIPKELHRIYSSVYLRGRNVKDGFINPKCYMMTGGMDKIICPIIDETDRVIFGLEGIGAVRDFKKYFLFGDAPMLLWNLHHLENDNRTTGNLEKGVVRSYWDVLESSFMNFPNYYSELMASFSGNHRMGDIFNRFLVVDQIVNNGGSYLRSILHERMVSALNVWENDLESQWLIFKNAMLQSSPSSSLPPPLLSFNFVAGDRIKSKQWEMLEKIITDYQNISRGRNQTKEGDVIRILRTIVETKMDCTFTNDNVWGPPVFNTCGNYKNIYTWTHVRLTQNDPANNNENNDDGLSCSLYGSNYTINFINSLMIDVRKYAPPNPVTVKERYSIKYIKNGIPYPSWMRIPHTETLIDNKNNHQPIFLMNAVLDAQNSDYSHTPSHCLKLSSMRGLFIYSSNFENMDMFAFKNITSTMKRMNKQSTHNFWFFIKANPDFMDCEKKNKFDWWCRFVLSIVSYFSLVLNYYHKKVILDPIFPKEKRKCNNKGGAFEFFKLCQHHYLSASPMTVRGPAADILQKELQWVCPCKECADSLHSLMKDNGGFWYMIRNKETGVWKSSGIRGCMTTSPSSDLGNGEVKNQIGARNNDDSLDSLKEPTGDYVEVDPETSARRMESVFLNSFWNCLEPTVLDDYEEIRRNSAFIENKLKHVGQSSIPTRMTNCNPTASAIEMATYLNVFVHLLLSRHFFTILEISLQKSLRKAEESRVLVASETNRNDDNIAGHYVEITNSEGVCLLADYMHSSTSVTTRDVITTNPGKKEEKDYNDSMMWHHISSQLPSCSFTSILNYHLIRREHNASLRKVINGFLEQIYIFINSLTFVHEQEKQNNSSVNRSLSSFMDLRAVGIKSKAKFDEFRKGYDPTTDFEERRALVMNNNINVFIPFHTNNTNVTNSGSPFYYTDKIDKDDRNSSYNHNDSDEDMGDTMISRSTFEKASERTTSAATTFQSKLELTQLSSDKRVMLKRNRSGDNGSSENEQPELRYINCDGKITVLTLGSLVIRMYLSLRTHLDKLWDGYPTADLISSDKKVFMVLEFLAKFLISHGGSIIFKDKLSEERNIMAPIVSLTRWKRNFCLVGDHCFSSNACFSLGGEKWVKKMIRPVDFTNDNNGTIINEPSLTMATAKDAAIPEHLPPTSSGNTKTEIPVCYTRVKVDESAADSKRVLMLFDKLNENLKEHGLSESMILSYVPPSTRPGITASKEEKQIPFDFNKNIADKIVRDRDDELCLLFQLYYHISRDSKHSIMTSADLDLHKTDVGNVLSYVTNVLWTDTISPEERYFKKISFAEEKDNVSILVDSLMSSFVD